MLQKNEESYDSSIDEELVVGLFDLFSIDEEPYDIGAPQFLDAR